MYLRSLLILILFTIAAVVGALSPRLNAQCSVPSYKFQPNTANPNISPNRPVVADFNRDGNLDAAFTNFVAGTTTIAIGNGAGGFTSSNIATGGGASFTVVGDFNRNGVPDLAVSHGTADNIAILLGTGNGTFTNGITIPNDNGSLALGDFNRDGIEDIVGLIGPTALKLYLGDGNGGFTAQPQLLADGTLTTVAVGDLNRDDRDDLAISQFGSARVAVFLGNGAGGFGTQTNFGVGDAPDAIMLADLNQDNRLDLVTGNVTSDNVSVLLGNGAGGFGAVTNYPTSIDPRSLATADSNGDGKLDIIVGHDEAGPTTLVGVLKNVGNGLFAPEVSLTLTGTGNSIAVGDFTRDDKDDIFVGVKGQGSAGHHFGLLANTCNLSPSNDFTGDGRADIAIFRPSNGFWFILRTDDFSFFSFPFGASGDIPVPADFDGDGKTDAAIFRPSNATWFIAQSTGGNRIEQFGISSDLPSPADYDGDGKADLAINRPGPNEWWVSKSTGGVFAVQFGAAGDIPIR